MIATRTSNPPVEPVTLDEIKEHLRMQEINDFDSMLLGLIKSSREWVESAIGRSLIQQTWKYYLQDWPPGDEFELPFPPLQSVTSIKYTDSDGTQTEWSNSEYEVDTDSEPGRVILGYGYTWPSTTLHPKNPIEIEFIAGYDDDGLSPADYRPNIPQAIKAAIMLDISIHFDMAKIDIPLYEDRRDALLAPYKIWRF